MELDKIFDKLNIEIDIRGNRVFVKKLVRIPLAEIISENKMLIYLDIKIPHTILKLVKQLQFHDINFSFISPVFSNPKSSVEYYHQKNIHTILYNYSNPIFWDGFNKIQFDITKNLVQYCTDNNCHELLKEEFDRVNEIVQQSWFDYYSKKRIYKIKRQDIRENFSTIYRDIQLNQLLT
jgi:hypothetical protein